MKLPDINNTLNQIPSYLYPRGGRVGYLDRVDICKRIHGDIGYEFGCLDILWYREVSHMLAACLWMGVFLIYVRLYGYTRRVGLIWIAMLCGVIVVKEVYLDPGGFGGSQQLALKGLIDVFSRIVPCIVFLVWYDWKR